MTPRQCKAARALLDWRQIDLSRQARVAVSTIRTFEAGQSTPKDVTLDLLRRAFKRAGIEFMAGGVRLR